MSDKEIFTKLVEHYKQVEKGYSTHIEHGGKCDEHEEQYIYMLLDVIGLLERQKGQINEANKLICELCEKCGENVCANGEECDWKGD